MGERGRQAERIGPRPTAADETARLFFALWPDAAPRAALGRLAQALHQECGGRVMLTRNIHLTLVFLGDVAASWIPDLRALAEGIVAQRFELAIATVNYWRHNRIVWAGPKECPDAMQMLVADLESALKAGDFRFDERPYAPHITLLRDARRAPAAQTVADIPWRIADFALVQSLHRDNASVYEAIQRWPLGAGKINGD